MTNFILFLRKTENVGIQSARPREWNFASHAPDIPTASRQPNKLSGNSLHRWFICFSPSPLLSFHFAPPLAGMIVSVPNVQKLVVKLRFQKQCSSCHNNIGTLQKNESLQPLLWDLRWSFRRCQIGNLTVHATRKIACTWNSSNRSRNQNKCEYRPLLQTGQRRKTPD